MRADALDQISIGNPEDATDLPFLYDGCLS